VRKNIDDTLATRARELARTLAGRNHIAIDTSADEVENTVPRCDEEIAPKRLQLIRRAGACHLMQGSSHHSPNSPNTATSLRRAARHFAPSKPSHRSNRNMNFSKRRDFRPMR